EMCIRDSSSTEPLHLLIVGGSLGARVLNEQVPAAVAAAGVPIEVRHQCGKGEPGTGPACSFKHLKPPTLTNTSKTSDEAR
ncbi:glycosyltransferase, partial [Aeromonas salmonicida]|uniref:glycosyltransferase n=1 Tax=Aeromonas salmonicida TaxID=645 RepID=UPI003D3163B6